MRGAQILLKTGVAEATSCRWKKRYGGLGLLEIRRLRLVRALTVETHQEWIEGTRYLNMELPREHKKLALKGVDEAA